jgi:hypothetical protein
MLRVDYVVANRCQTALLFLEEEKKRRRRFGTVLICALL